MSKKLNEKDPIIQRLDCLILLSCLKESSEKEKLNIAVNCLGLRETARLLGKDSGNLCRAISKKRIKNEKVRTEVDNGE